MSSFCGPPTEVWRTESTTFPTLLELPSNCISQPCSRLTGVVFHGALLLPRGFASDDGWRDVKSNSQQIECTICTESNLASSAFIIRCPCPANFGSQSSALWCQPYLRPIGRPTFDVQFGDCFNFTWKDGGHWKLGWDGSATVATWIWHNSCGVLHSVCRRLLFHRLAQTCSLTGPLKPS